MFCTVGVIGRIFNHYCAERMQLVKNLLTARVYLLPAAVVKASALHNMNYFEAESTGSEDSLTTLIPDITASEQV